MALQGWEKREGTHYHPGLGVYLLDLHTFNGLVVATAKGDHLLPIDTIIFPEPDRGEPDPIGSFALAYTG